MKKLSIREAYAEWRKTHPRPRLFEGPPDEGPFRTQGPKPPPPPKPPAIPRYTRTWRQALHDWDDDHPIQVFAVIVLLTLGVIVGGAWMLTVIGHRLSPCVGGESLSGTRASTMPDGTPVQIQVKWCAAYKPGREGETP